MIKIPNYEIGKLAGRGGVAEVYLATHKLLDRTVAIKLISPAKAGDHADKRFLKEAKVVAGLRHPNIVSIYDVGVLENKYYIIMEYLEGGDLKQQIKNGISAARSLEILKEIGSALAHAHDKGFIHRDIKSQNIMFRADDTAVLTDFGIVKDLTVDSGYTLDGTSIGTPHYMSPEQAQGSSKIDYRTDLYSLGVTFYEMLTGRVPYQADSPVAVALKHIKDPVPRLPEHLLRYQSIIDRLMAKKPENRFQSAHELVTVLGRMIALDSRETPTEVMEYADRTVFKPRKPWAKVRPGFLLASLAAAGVMAGLLIFAPPYLADFFDRQASENKNSLKTAASSESPKPTVEPVEPADSGEAAPESPDSEVQALADEASRPAFDKAVLTRAITNRNYIGALDDIAEIRKNLPASTNELLLKADNFLAAGQFINAADAYNTVLSVDSRNTAAVMGLLHVAVEKQKRLETQKSPSTRDFSAQLELLAKGVENTNSPFFKHLKINTVETIYETGRQRLMTEAPGSALEMAETGLEYAPAHLRLKKLRLFALARISFNDKRLTVPEQDNALAYYRRVMELDPLDPDAVAGVQKIADWFENKARAAHENKNYAEAVQQIEKARAISPQDNETKVLEWLIRGDMHYARGDYAAPENENARFFYRKVLAELPDNEKVALRLDKIDVLAPLAEISAKKGAISVKIPVYREAFQSFKAAVAAHGSKATADLRAVVTESIESAIEAQKHSRTEIPNEFVNLVTSHFPEFDNIFNVQYEILLTKGDDQNPVTRRADFYLAAFKLAPARTQAREKIEAAAHALENAGKPNEALAVLNRAIEIAPGETEFKKLAREIRQVRDKKAELFTKLYQIKLIQPFAERIEAYRKLFEELESAAAEYGRDKIAGPRQEAAARLKADIQSRKANARPMPDEFIDLVKMHFPSLKRDIINAQYDILINKGAAAFSVDEKSDYFLQALGLDPTRTEAPEKIRNLADKINGNEKYQAAVNLLEEAMDIAPGNDRLADFYHSIHRKVEVYPTQGGCSPENIISQAPVTKESINLCIHYRNLRADSIVNVMLARKGGRAMEVPVLLTGSSGSKPITVASPIEGFAVGDYEIIVKQDAEVLSHSRFQFTPKRR